MRSRIVNYPNVTSTLALVIALSGGAYAAGVGRNTVGTAQLKRAAVTAPKLHKNAVTTSKIASKAVTSGKIAPGAVGTDIIADGSVGLADIAPEVTTAISGLVNSVAPTMVTVSDSGIQNVGPTNGTFATMTVPNPGTYLVVGALRVFSRAVNPGHSLFCTFGDGPNLVNNFVNSSEVESIPLTGPITTTSPNEAVNLICRQGSGSGEITLTYDISAVKVVG